MDVISRQPLRYGSFVWQQTGVLQHPLPAANGGAAGGDTRRAALATSVRAVVEEALGAEVRTPTTFCEQIGDPDVVERANVRNDLLDAETFPSEHAPRYRNALACHDPEERAMKALGQVATTPTRSVGFSRRKVDVPSLIDEIVVREGEDDFRVTLKGWDEHSEERWRPPVIVVQNGDVLTPRQSQAGKEVFHHPKPGILLHPADPRIGHRGSEATCVLRIPVVGHDDFEVVKRPVEDAAQCLREPDRTVVRRQDDAYMGMSVDRGR
jgi:hypothetical protein